MNKLNERLTWIFQELSKIAESLNRKKSIIRCKDCAENITEYLRNLERNQAAFLDALNEWAETNKDAEK